MPHFSVTIPVFNRAHLIGRTIESVLDQEYSDFELLVVDDASTDNTIDVVREYCKADQRVKLFINPKNLGLTRNWNRCLDLAQGDLVQVLLSDDLIDADYLKLAAGQFDQHAETGFLASVCRYVDIDDGIIHPGIPQADCAFQAGDEAVSWFLVNGFPHVSSIVARWECFEAVGKFDERIWHGPDVEMDARLASRFSFFYFGEAHTSFRRHGSNMGNMEYLRKDFLEVDRLKRELAWGYLSEAGRSRLGVDNLNRYLDRTEAQVALTGALATMGFRRADLSRFYLTQAVMLDKGVMRTSLFLKGLGINLLPWVSQPMLSRKYKIEAHDQSQAKLVEKSLAAIR